MAFIPISKQPIKTAKHHEAALYSHVFYCSLSVE